MDLNWFQSILYGLISGLADILPVSAQAHRAILLKVFGAAGEPGLLRLLIHLSTLAALYISSQSQIIRIIRAKKLAKVPKRRRKRPLDARSLMDFELLKTTLIPIILGFLFYNTTSAWSSSLLMVAFFLFINGLVQYLPQFIPGSNKDSRGMSRVEGLLMGLGGGLSVLPGISCVGTATAIGEVTGVDRTYALNTALLMNMPVTVGLILFDLVSIVNGGLGPMTFGTFLCYILSAGAAFGGVFGGIKLMRALAPNVGFSGFGYYSWGAALFALILYLTV